MLKKLVSIVFVSSMILFNSFDFEIMAQDSGEAADFIKYYYVPPSHITKLINVPYLDQNDIASGCEAVSATMLLQRYGYYVSKKTFVNEFLIKKDWFVDEQTDEIFGPDPNSAYVGNPYIASGNNCGFGCYSNAIAKSINLYFDKNEIVSQQAIALKDKSLSYLVKNYISKDIPVLIWATMDMKPSKLTMSWTINFADEDSNYNVSDKYTWIAHEHCLVLVGYDYYRYYFNDPYKDHGIIGYDKEIVEKRFSELGNMSVVILNK